MSHFIFIEGVVCTTLETFAAQPGLLLSLFMDYTVGFAISIFVVGLIGFKANLLVLFLSYKTHIFQSTIGLLIRNTALFSSLFSLIFICYAAPASFLYNVIFTQSRTFVMIISLVVFGVLVVSIHLVSPDCWLIFNFSSGFFTYKNTKCGKLLRVNIQFPRNVVVIGVASLLDLSTFFKIRQLNKKRLLFSGSSVAESRRRNRAEQCLMKQICIQSSVYIIEFTTYFILSNIVDGDIIKFVLTTFAWQLVHAIDASVVLLMNREMRSYILCKTLNTASAVSITPQDIKRSTITRF